MLYVNHRETQLLFFFFVVFLTSIPKGGQGKPKQRIACVVEFQEVNFRRIPIQLGIPLCPQIVKQELFATSFVPFSLV